MVIRQGACWGLMALVLAGVSGCLVVSNLPAPGQIVEDREIDTGRRYHLYVPTSYDGRREFPLLVTCHGTPPWDTATAQLAEWKGYAEQKGFLVLAPELVGTRGDFPMDPQGQIARQIEDEQAILGMIRSVQAARRVNRTCIFITGWSAGNFAALFTGLRNPNVFRAVAVRQGNFNPAFFEPCIPFIDPYQPVLLTIGDWDILVKEQGLACADWLRARGMDPQVLTRVGAHRRDPEPVLSFFLEVARKRPWVRVLVTEDPVDPLRISAITLTSFEPERFLWDFGDGSPRSPLARVEHAYDRPGLYTLRVAVWPAGRKDPVVRAVALQVPRPRLGVAAPPGATSPSP